MARPKTAPEFATDVRTWSFYEKDIVAVQASGVSPKELLRLGILAHNEAWRPGQQNKEIEALEMRMGKLSAVLTNYGDKLAIISDIVSKYFDNQEKLKIPENVHTKELREKLLKIEEIRRARDNLKHGTNTRN